MLRNYLSAAALCMLVFCGTVSGQSSAERSFASLERFSVPQQLSVSPTGLVTRIQVNNQADLARLNTSVKTAVNKGAKNIEVVLGPGVFYYDRLAVYLYKIDAKDVSIHIRGNQTVMVAAGKDYVNGRSLTEFDAKDVFLDREGNLIDYYTDVQQALSQVEVVNASRKECKMKIAGKATYVPGMKIQLSEWFHCPTYEVKAIQGGYVHFIANDLSYDKAKRCYNVQYDNAIGSINPRFRFLDPSVLRTQRASFYKSSVSQFLILYRMKLKSFGISGIRFLGCANGNEALFYFRDMEAEEVFVRDCKFEQMNNLVCNLKNTDHFEFSDNELDNCFYGALNSAVDCANTLVTDNRFHRMGKGWTNGSVVSCHGADFLISGNTFEDFSYSAISTGYNYKWGNKKITRGVIENNEIFYGDEYFSNSHKYTLMDGGAIYVSTMSDQVIVRYNYIHDYRGIRSNRGIYCDDGAMNVKIYGNVLRNIPDADAVFSWRARSVNGKIAESNDGICMYYNVIWGSYKLDERPNSSCIHGKNLILYGKGEAAPKNELVNFKYQEKDILSSGAEVVDNKLRIPEAAMKELQRFPTYARMRQWFE